MSLRRIGAYLRTFETHALEVAVGDLTSPRGHAGAHLRTYDTHALKEAVACRRGTKIAKMLLVDCLFKSVYFI